MMAQVLRIIAKIKLNKNQRLMKTRILTAVLALTSVVAFAQNREIRRAGSAIDDGNYQEAMDYLNQAEPEIADANQSRQADFYLYRGFALVGDGENVSTEDLLAAAEAFKKAQELEHERATEGIQTVSNALINGAINDQNSQDFDSATEKLYAGYQLNQQDTIYLYYAASNAVNAGSYETALNYYEELKDLGFTGVTTQFLATNKETGEDELMPSAEQMDLFVKAGTHTNPRTEVTESRKGEIAKNTALIYIERGEQEKAITAMEEAKAENPNDIALLQAEADMYYNMDDMAKYREIMEQVVEQDPENPNLYYNLGVSTSELGDNEKALEYYEKALELDPQMTNARINMAFLILSKERDIVEEMNQLGTSAADNKKYDALAEERQAIYSQALPHLEAVLENDPSNIEAARTMMNIYYQLDQADKAEEMQSKINELEAAQ